MLTLLWAKHALCARLGLSAVYYSTQKKLAGVAVPASSPLSSEGFNMMSTSVSQRRSRKHRPTRATGPSIYPALIFSQVLPGSYTAHLTDNIPASFATLAAILRLINLDGL